MVLSNTDQPVNRRGALALWMGIFLLSFWWQFAIAVYTQPKPLVSWICLAVAVVCLWYANRVAAVRWRTGAWGWLWFVAAILAAIMLPMPHATGAWMLAAGLVAGRLAKWVRPLHAPGAAVGLAGLVLSLQAPLDRLFVYLSGWEHLIEQAAWPLATIINTLGHDAIHNGWKVYIENIRGHQIFRPTLELLAVYPALNFLLAAVLLVWLTQKFDRAVRSTLCLFILVPIYLVARAGLMISLYHYDNTYAGFFSELASLHLLWSPWTMLVSLLPLAWVCSRFLYYGQDARFLGGLVRSPCWDVRAGVTIVSLGLAAVFFVVAIGWEDPGLKKRGRVVMDEYHSDWEESDYYPFDEPPIGDHGPYDKRYYGSMSSYKFSGVADYMKYFYDFSKWGDEADKDREKEFTKEMLDEVDVLILKCPTLDYTAEEQALLVDYVRRGGGIFMVGDHTNVFGMNIILNSVADDLGFKFRHDCIFDIDRRMEQIYDHPAMLPHPVVQHMPTFRFQTACSIEPQSFACKPIILIGGLKTGPLDYHMGNFYAHIKDRSMDEYGAFVQGCAAKFGKGRVVAFADSTCMSNFSMFEPGKLEFWMMSMEWLNRTNRYSWINPVMGLLSGVFAIIGVMLLITRTRMFHRLLIPATVTVMVATAVSAAVVDKGNEDRYSMPTPKRQPVRVAFETEHCNITLTSGGSTKSEPNCYGMIYMWMLRMGYFPYTAETFDAAIDPANTIALFINPTKTFSDEQAERAEEFVKNGGRIIVMDATGNSLSTANALLDPFDHMHINRSPALRARAQAIQHQMGDVPLGPPGMDRRTPLTPQQKAWMQQQLQQRSGATPVAPPDLRQGLLRRMRETLERLEQQSRYQPTKPQVILAAYQPEPPPSPPSDRRQRVIDRMRGKETPPPDTQPARSAPARRRQPPTTPGQRPPHQQARRRTLPSPRPGLAARGRRPAPPSAFSPTPATIPLTTAGGRDLCKVSNYLPIVRGTPLVHAEGDPAMSVVRAGEGMCVALGFGERFSSPQFGRTRQIHPDAQMTKVFDLFYSIFEGVAEDRIDELFLQPARPKTPQRRQDAGRMLPQRKQQK